MSFSNKIKKEIKENILNNVNPSNDYLANIFLKSGYIVNPNKSYHLEFVFNNEEEAIKTLGYLNLHGLKSKMIKRRKSYVTYLKECDNITDFLNIIGVHDALMEFHNIRILKDISGNINRKVNLETANLNKTVSAALTYEEDIKFLLNYKTSELSPELEKLAKFRLQYVDATLKELGEKFDPFLSKSCVNHRLRKIKKISENLRKV